MGLHRTLPFSEAHCAHAFEYANAAARTGATGFTSSDVGKLARQIDDNSFWLLTATTPTWLFFAGGSSGSVPTSRRVDTGTGLSGGGDLTTDRTIAIVFGNTLGTVCQGNDARLSDSRTPTAHATSHRGNGSDPIAVVTTAIDGLMSAADKVKLDSIVPGALKQTGFAEVASDTTSTSKTFADLLTLNLTTGAGYLAVWAGGAISNTKVNVNMKLRLLLDGVSMGGVQLRSAATGIAIGFNINHRMSVIAGAHTLKIQWLTAFGTMQCRPVSGNVDGEHASILAQEVTV